jgi:hypothetical protein
VIDNLEEKYLTPDERIKWAREYNNKLMLHVHGIGLEQALSDINGYENETQKKARDKFAISNKFITDRLLRPTDSVFSAKGGYKKYVFDTNAEVAEKKFVMNLIDVYSGYNLSQYIHRVWFDKYIVDPNGLIFMEVSDDANEIYPAYKSIQSIRNYKQDGIKVDWVIFEPDEYLFDEDPKKKDPKAEMFWAVDETAYYRCIKDKEGVRVLSERGHNFGAVPATLCSDVEDPVSGWKKSPIDAQVELLNKFMTDNSVLNIVEFFHCYPRAWELVSDCRRCNGTGQIQGGELRRDGTLDTTCPVCHGNGLQESKDVTDVIRVTVPADKEEHLITNPGGYIEAPSESWNLQTKSVDRTWNIIMFSHWGTSLEYGSNEGSQYATATGRFIDTQPVNNKLNRYTESVQLIHNSIASIYGKFYFPETFVKSDVVYGRRYLIETPDQLKKSYSDLVTVSNNSIMADIIWEQYLESEFRDNDQMYAYNKKLSALDPFPHLKISDIQELGMTNELHKKLFVTDYKNSRSTQFIIETPIEDLRKDYSDFINEKLAK